MGLDLRGLEDLVGLGKISIITHYALKYPSLPTWHFGLSNAQSPTRQSTGPANFPPLTCGGHLSSFTFNYFFHRIGGRI